MLEIVLVRHGRPLMDHHSRIRGPESAAWVAGFEQAPLDETLRPPPALMARAAAAQCIVTSTLRRSIESAALLAPGRPVLTDLLFVEAGMPVAMPGSLAIRPKHWNVFARIAWMAGWSKGTESWQAARHRAKRAAERLSELAGKHGSVLLVGHGMLNALLQRALRRTGWSGGGWRSAYWSYVVLTRPQ